LREGRRCLGCGSELVLELPGDFCPECERNPKHEITVATQTIVSLSNPGGSASVEAPALRRWFLGLALALGGVVFACYAFGACLIITHSETAKPFGWEAALRNHRWIVSGVDPSGAVAGKLHNGDRLLAFNEDRRAEQIGPELFMYFLPPGSAYTIDVWRNPPDSDIALTLQLPKRPSSRFTLSRVLGLIPGLIEPLAGIIHGVGATGLPLGQARFCIFSCLVGTGLVLSIRARITSHWKEQWCSSTWGGFCVW
jgi:hypothetical protein